MVFFVIRFVLDTNCFFEIARAFLRATDSRKESRWLSYLSYSVVKEPTSAKGRLDCHPFTSVSSEISPDERRDSV